MKRVFTADVRREDDMYVALCRDIDIASQGETVSLARDNLREAIELFMEDADPDEIATRLRQRYSY